MPIIYMDMNEQAEIIDSSGMQIISCLPVEYENDEQVTVPENAEKSEVCVGSLDENIIVASRSKKSGRLISEIAFERKNVSFVADGLSKLLSADKPPNSTVEFENGADKFLITFSSSWAHNLPAPLERINFYNHRDYELDDLRSRDIWLSLPPPAARRLAEELAKLF